MPTRIFMLATLLAALAAPAARAGTYELVAGGVEKMPPGRERKVPVEKAVEVGPRDVILVTLWARPSARRNIYELADDLGLTLGTSKLARGVTYALTVRGVRDRARLPNTVAPRARATFVFVEVGDGLTGTYWARRERGAEDSAGRAALEAGKLYEIRMEYYEGGGEASAELFWQSPSTPRQTVPRKCLYAR